MLVEAKAFVFAVLFVHWTDMTHSWFHPPVPYPSYVECLEALPQFDDPAMLEAMDPHGRKFNAVRGWCLTIKDVPDEGV